MPLNINAAYIEITNLCNLDCQTCYNRSGKNQVRKEISFAHFQFITERLINDFGCTTIILSGGEPTLHSQFAEILAYLFSLSSLQVCVVTNGTTNCKMLIDAYQTHQKMMIQVSLDGSDEESNARTRGKDRFDQAISFIKALRNPDRQPIMKMVVSQNNLSKVEEYYRLAISLGCVPGFDFINEMGNAKDSWEKLVPTAQQKLAVLRTIARLNDEYDQEVYIPTCTTACIFLNPNASLSVSVKTDGTLQPCQILYDSAYSLGNLLHDQTDTITARYAALSNLTNERAAESESCFKCVAKDTCKRGCLAASIMKSGDPFGSDGECTFRKLQLLAYEVPKYHV